VRSKIFSPTWASPEVVSTKNEGREGAGVASPAPGPAPRSMAGVSKNVLEDLEQIDKSPPKCPQTRDPKTRGQIPKRRAFAFSLSPLSAFCCFALCFALRGPAARRLLPPLLGGGRAKGQEGAGARRCLVHQEGMELDTVVSGSAGKRRRNDDNRNARNGKRSEERSDAGM
jgi:hypothetical protein